MPPVRSGHLSAVWLWGAASFCFAVPAGTAISGGGPGGSSCGSLERVSRCVPGPQPPRQILCVHGGHLPSAEHLCLLLDLPGCAHRHASCRHGYTGEHRGNARQEKERWRPVTTTTTIFLP